jgi:CBS domain containing-hemolysin-like protein
MSALVPGLIVVLLALVNGLFVAAEFAIVGAPRATLERKAADGSRAARRVSDILRDPRKQDRYIATAQIGITFASLGLGMYGEHQLAVWIDERLVTWDGLPGWVAVHSLATVLAIALLTYLHIVIGEMVPKSLALQHAEGTALGVTPVMVWFRRLVYPLVVSLNAIGNMILRLAGVDRSEGSHDHYYSAEELEFVVEESLGAGLINRGSGRVLRELFDLGARSAEDVMAPRVQVHGIDERATTEDIRALILDHTHTRYPVYREDIDDIIGVAHVRELAALAMSGRPLAPEHIHPVP